jgi:hypothetical protein
VGPVVAIEGQPVTYGSRERALRGTRHPASFYRGAVSTILVRPCYVIPALKRGTSRCEVIDHTRASTPRIYAAPPRRWDQLDGQAGEMERDSDLDLENGWVVGSEALPSIAAGSRGVARQQRRTSGASPAIERALQSVGCWHRAGCGEFGKRLQAQRATTDATRAEQRRAVLRSR